MPMFTFFKHHEGKVTPEFELEICDDLEAAAAHARKMIAKDGHEAVEIFDSEDSLQIVRQA